MRSKMERAPNGGGGEGAKPSPTTPDWKRGETCLPSVTLGAGLESSLARASDETACPRLYCVAHCEGRDCRAPKGQRARCAPRATGGAAQAKHRSQDLTPPPRGHLDARSFVRQFATQPQNLRLRLLVPSRQPIQERLHFAEEPL